MTPTGNVEEALGDLAGPLIGPGHPSTTLLDGYNAMVDKSPALIA